MKAWNPGCVVLSFADTFTCSVFSRVTHLRTGEPTKGPTKVNNCGQCCVLFVFDLYLMPGFDASSYMQKFRGRTCF